MHRRSKRWTPELPEVRPQEWMPTIWRSVSVRWLRCLENVSQAAILVTKPWRQFEGSRCIDYAKKYKCGEGLVNCFVIMYTASPPFSLSQQQGYDDTAYLSLKSPLVPVLCPMSDFARGALTASLAAVLHVEETASAEEGSQQQNKQQQQTAAAALPSGSLIYMLHLSPQAPADAATDKFEQQLRK